MNCHVTNILDNPEYDIVRENIDINNTELQSDQKENQILNIKKKSLTNFFDLYFLMKVIGFKQQKNFHLNNSKRALSVGKKKNSKK